MVCISLLRTENTYFVTRLFGMEIDSTLLIDLLTSTIIVQVFFLRDWKKNLISRRQKLHIQHIFVVYSCT